MDEYAIGTCVGERREIRYEGKDGVGTFVNPPGPGGGVSTQFMGPDSRYTY